jgi:ABC-type transport system involved in Fe-S cluster assembly fused permease/ATPase subunit
MAFFKSKVPWRQSRIQTLEGSASVPSWFLHQQLVKLMSAAAVYEFDSGIHIVLEMFEHLLVYCIVFFVISKPVAYRKRDIKSAGGFLNAERKEFFAVYESVIEFHA